MQVFVGTSGWSYPWNEGGTLDWFVQNSGLNSIELNASFYRFPFKNQIAGWAKRGKDLRWVIKTHRLITHQHKLNDEALEAWGKFKELFLPLDPFVEFYLFQLPPGFSDLERVGGFLPKTELGSRFALELRNKGLLSDPELPWKVPPDLTIVSQDSPDFKEKLFPGKTIYLRMHGRKEWYSYDYSKEELESLSLKIKEMSPERVLVMFNNDHAMLKNARMMYEVLTRD